MEIKDNQYSRYDLSHLRPIHNPRRFLRIRGSQWQIHRANQCLRIHIRDSLLTQYSRDTRRHPLCMSPLEVLALQVIRHPNRDECQGVPPQNYLVRWESAHCGSAGDA